MRTVELNRRSRVSISIYIVTMKTVELNRRSSRYFGAAGASRGAGIFACRTREEASTTEAKAVEVNHRSSQYFFGAAGTAFRAQHAAFAGQRPSKWIAGPWEWRVRYGALVDEWVVASHPSNSVGHSPCPGSWITTFRHWVHQISINRNASQEKQR